MPDRAQFKDVIDKYFTAYAAHDAAGCANVYTPEGQIFSPFGPPITGKPAIAAAHALWFQEGETNKEVNILEAQFDGDVGFCALSFSADVPAASGGADRVYGSSLNTMLRQADGAWKIRHTSLNDLEDDALGNTT